MPGVRRGEFSEPPEVYRPGYFWCINDKMDVKELISQLRDMAAQGARSVCLHPFPKEFRPTTMPSAMEPPYLSPEYFKVIKKVVAECERLGLNYWLYDEGGWPSGGACGQIMKIDPERYARTYIVDHGNGPEVSREPYEPRGPVPYPNLITPGVTDHFIRLTHERHRLSVGKHFGKTIRFAFMDEPSLPSTQPGSRLTWTADFGTVFRRRKGYALEPYLADLLKYPSANREIQRVRVDFHDTCSQLFLERFMLPIRKWCRKNSLISGGHLNGEDEPRGNADYGFGHILRALRALDLPGVDVIWRQLFPGVRSHVFPKYASSVAHQTGRRFALAEVFAVYGNGIQPRQMKWLIDYLLVRGITTFVLSNITQTRRDHGMAGCRPHLGPVDPLWKYSDLLHRYISRLGYMLSQGRPAATTAFYHDVRSIWAGGKDREAAIEHHNLLSEKLLQMQCDFDFIDDDQLSEAVIENGILKIGRMRYNTLVMPPSEWVTDNAAAAVNAFSRSGGRVVGPDTLSQVAPLVRLTPASDSIRVCKRLLGKQALYFFTNEAAETVKLKIGIPDRGSIVLCQPDDGKLYGVPSDGGAFEWEFEPYGSALFLTGAKADDPLPEPVSGTEIGLKDGWTIRPLVSHRPGKHEYEIETLKAEPRQAALGDWREYVGGGFSGDAVYSLEFVSPVAGKAVLDLGKVLYACSVKLNGRVVGREFFGPFRFAVRLRQGVNRLDITVSNTLANAISPAEVETYWAEKCPPVSPYESRQRVFERDSLPSGMLGPVKLILPSAD
jgi:hypothetical protein